MRCAQAEMAQNELSTTRRGYDGDRNACMLPHCSLDFGAVRAFVGASEATHAHNIGGRLSRQTFIKELPNFQTPTHPYHIFALVPRRFVAFRHQRAVIIVVNSSPQFWTPTLPLHTGGHCSALPHR